MNPQIRRRLTLPVCLVILTTTILLATLLPEYIYEFSLDQIEHDSQQELDMIQAAFSSVDLQTEPEEEIQALTESYGQILDKNLAVLSPAGQLLADSESPPPYPETSYQYLDLEKAARLGFSSGFQADSGDKEILHAVVPLYQGTSLDGYLFLKTPLASLQEQVQKLRLILLAAGGALTLTAYLLIYLVSRGITHPLASITQSIRKITTHEKDQLLTLSPGIHQIAELRAAVNSLLTQFRNQIQNLESERGTLQSVLTQMTDGVIIVDDQGKISLLNPAAEDIFGIAVQDAAGRSAAEVLRHHQWIKIWQNCLKTEKKQSTSLENPSRSSLLQGFAIPLEENLPGHTLLLFQDLSRIKRLETTRQDFISNVSHELRTPLASLKALTDTLQDGALEDPPAAKRFLSRIDTEVDALVQMVGELLELSRIESGQVPLNLEPVKPQLLLTQAGERMRAQAERRRVKITADTPENSPSVQADFPRIERVLVNLLHNAIKFSPPGGEILLQTNLQENSVIFSVQDQGPGIPPADLNRIFERFYKTDQARSSGGTGLGLAIAKHLVEAHGGRIWAESLINQGSTFYFSLPSAD